MSSPAAAVPRLAIGVDVGGTKIATGLVRDDGTVLASTLLPTRTGDGEGLAADILASVSRVLEQASPRPGVVVGIGVGLPAVTDPGGRTVQWAPNIPGLNGFPLATRIEQATGLRTVLAYDGHTATLAEHWVGAGRNARNMLLLIIGTGVGGGIVADGRLLRGAHGLAGAFGWLTLGDPVPEAGRLGWLESMVAGPAILRAARSIGGFMSTEEVFQRAHAGDPAAERIIEQVGMLLGRAVASLVSALDTEMVVLAGGVGANGALLVPHIERQLHSLAQPYVRQGVTIRLASLGSAAGVIGSARLMMLEAPPTGAPSLRQFEQ